MQTTDCRHLFFLKVCVRIFTCKLGAYICILWDTIQRSQPGMNVMLMYNSTPRLCKVNIQFLVPLCALHAPAKPDQYTCAN